MVGMKEVPLPKTTNWKVSDRNRIIETKKGILSGMPFFLDTFSSPSIQYPEANGLIDLFEVFDHILTVLLIDVGDHVTNGFVGLQILSYHIDAVLGQDVIDLFKHLIEPLEAKRWEAKKALPALKNVLDSLRSEH